MLILQEESPLVVSYSSLINRAQALEIHIEDLICTYLFFVMGDARDADKLETARRKSTDVRIRFGRVPRTGRHRPGVQSN